MQRFKAGAIREDDAHKPQFHRVSWRIRNWIQLLMGGTRFRPDKRYPLDLSYTQNHIKADYIPTIAWWRISRVMQAGANKYGVDNYRKGIPLSNMLASLHRHLAAYEAGDTSEDHLAAIGTNVIMMLYMEHAASREMIDGDFIDAGPAKNRLFLDAYNVDERVHEEDRLNVLKARLNGG